MTGTPKHSVSVAGIVVRDDGHILVVQRRDNQHWEPPGGVLELEETVEAGVRREVLEETGVDIQVERLSGVYKNMPRGIVALVFRCRPLSVAMNSTAEADQVGWLTVEEITEQMDPAYAVRVSDALTDEPVTRVHDGTNLLTA
jgi:8-oxo-dGTP diphosphatase